MEHDRDNSGLWWFIGIVGVIILGIILWFAFTGWNVDETPMDNNPDNTITAPDNNNNTDNDNEDDGILDMDDDDDDDDRDDNPGTP